MNKSFRDEDALKYHSEGRPGKIEVIPTTQTKSQRDLSLAYSPGVAVPCLAIKDNPEDVYKYTAKSNLVAVISNGTAVLGLGDIGPEASKPVMEGKGLLFKIYADIDVFDIEVNAKSVDEFVNVVKALEPTFGGINLEDIAAPEAFEIERRLKAETKIPVMHDDQHGTAIISTAALLNALELADKKIEDIEVIVSGAGAAGISCIKLWHAIGVKKENIVMFDRNGQVSSDRTDLDEWKAEFAVPKKYNSLAEAMKDTDVFLGLSVGGLVDQAMVKSMAKNPIVFALANPNPEISYEEAKAAREDVIVATGRSDFPNQVNNVLGFPYIFRGALDCRASAINDEMKMAASKALAKLAKEPVPEMVNIAYNKSMIRFGKDYIIPKPVDPRLLSIVAPAVAKAAIESGVARKEIKNWDKYKEELNKRLGLENRLIRTITGKAKQNKKRLVFAEAHNSKIIKAAQIVKDEGYAEPILLGDTKEIIAIIEKFRFNKDDFTIIDPRSEEFESKRIEFGKILYDKRKRKGLSEFDAINLMRQRNYFGCMLVEKGEADAFLSGLTRTYPETIRPALQIIGAREDVKKVAGMYIMVTKNGPLFFADTTVNVNPSAEELADIALMVSEEVKNLGIEPIVALLSYSNFGSTNLGGLDKIHKALKIVKERNPELTIDGEIQANVALDKKMLKKLYPFSDLVGKDVNVLIFPNLESGNISYKLVQSIGNVEAIGPVLVGLKKPVHVLQMGSSIREIVNMAAIAVVDAQT